MDTKKFPDQFWGKNLEQLPELRALLDEGEPQPGGWHTRYRCLESGEEWEEIYVAIGRGELPVVRRVGARCTWFQTPPLKEVLGSGTELDRFGYEGGRFISPPGSDFHQRGQPGELDWEPCSLYRVVRPLDVESGLAAATAASTGGGKQYELPASVAELVDAGVLERLRVSSGLGGSPFRPERERKDVREGAEKELVEALRERLDGAATRVRAYSIDGAPRDEAYTLLRSGAHWLVFYSERDIRRDERKHDSLEAACADIEARLARDPSAHRKAR